LIQRPRRHARVGVIGVASELTLADDCPVSAHPAHDDKWIDADARGFGSYPRGVGFYARAFFPCLRLLTASWFHSQPSLGGVRTGHGASGEDALRD
jgi:hypothetical protein